MMISKKYHENIGAVKHRHAFIPMSPPVSMRLDDDGYAHRRILAGCTPDLPFICHFWYNPSMEVRNASTII